ncbi:TPA: hypothetical protein VAM20_000709 [Acinetobacter baumannii]|nr:hypothetical protein [Acinetobacter baumannii]
MENREAVLTSNIHEFFFEGLTQLYLSLKQQGQYHSPSYLFQYFPRVATRWASSLFEGFFLTIGGFVAQTYL